MNLSLSLSLSLLAALCLAGSAFAAPASVTGTLTADSAYTLPQGGQTTVTVAAAGYPGTTTALGWTVNLPTGWAYVSGSGEPAVKPVAGQTGKLEWAYLSIPESATYSFIVSYPADLSSPTDLTSSLIVRQSGSAALTITPDPLTLTPATAPVITSATTASATFGSTLSYNITATSPIPVTSYAASGLPTGVTLNADTGAISGAPTATGTFNVSLSATNAAGTGTAALAITVAQANASIGLGNLSATYNQAAHAVTATTTPGGLKVSLLYNGSATAPTDAGSYAVSASLDEANYSATASGTLVIAPANQAISFGAVGSPQPGDTVALSAVATSGLPVTLALISGSAQLTGSNLAVNGPGEIVVRATQVGTNNYRAVSADLTLNARFLSQTITFDPVSTKRGNDEAFTLSATASSGLPVSFTLVSGPAFLSGNQIKPTGAAGFVSLRADQSGNDIYAAAPAVIQTFEVLQVGPLVFFGTTDLGDEIAVNIKPDRSGGTLIGFLASTGEGFVVTFTLNADGSFATTSVTFTSGSLTPAPSSGRAIGADAPTRTFSGAVLGNLFSGAIPELGLNFSATLEPPSGSTAPLAGYYTASSLNDASGATYSVVGTNGKAYVLVVTPGIVTGSGGAINRDGSFSVQTAQAVTIAGNVNVADTTVFGTLILPDGSEDDFAGLSTGTQRTDRLINLSTRAYVDVAAGGPLVTGFVIGGTTDKQVLLRAVGPTLGTFGITTALPDPSMTIFNAAGEAIAEVDNWDNSESTAATMARIGAFPLPAGSKDAVFTTSLAPGTYTMHVSNQGAPGVALAEIYDASENPNSEYQRLINISSRGRVVGNEGVLVGGFIVTGNSPKRVLVRGIGPALTTYDVPGILSDPRIELFGANEQLIARNDNWDHPDPIFAGQRTATAAEIATISARVGAFALETDNKDAALVITLQPGAYTVQLDSASSGQQGNALIEIYEIPE